MRLGTGFFLIFIFLICFSLAFIGATSEINEVQSIDKKLDNHVSINDFQYSENSYMYDSKGNLISEIYSSENRIYLPYEEIPQRFIDAFIATEDRQFFDHKGFDINGITRAIFVNAAQQQIEQGGSTITQQLIKNTYLSNEQTYNRKLTEVLYSYQLEKMFSKEKILELYLNSIYFQNGTYGIEAASQFYFSKQASELSVAEVAYLSAVPNNPTIYNPLEHPENTNARKEWILKKMLEMNFLTIEQFNAALEQPITLSLKKKADHFPDYVTYIHYEFLTLVGKKEGYNEKISAAKTSEEAEEWIQKRKARVEQLLASGIHIYTALVPELQQKAVSTVERQLPQKNLQGSAVMIDHHKQSIVAITGGKQFRKFDFHRGFQAYRQPGSSIKPLLVFGPYLSETKASISMTVNAGPFCKNNYCPKNYGGAVYGHTSIETAFKHSYNTAAVRMMDQIGISTAFSYFNKFQFSKIGIEDQLLPAALGGLTYGVTPLEMTNAYTVFANGGVFQVAKGIDKVVDKEGNILFQWELPEVELWNKDVNGKMRTLLNKVVTEGTGRIANYSTTYIGGKTGTTNAFHDLWFIGLNEHYTTGVWIGYDTPQSLISVNSRSPHLHIWREIMK